MPLLFIITLLSRERIDRFSAIEIPDIINATISLIGLIFLCIYMWGVLVGILIKLMQVIIEIKNKKNTQKSYIINASFFLVLSYFITKQYDISLNNIIDSLAQGDILSIPIFLIILLPLFLSLIQSLENLIMKDNKVKERTGELLRNIILGIIESLLNFIKFTTADFLTSIQEIVKEDLNDETEISECTDKDLGEKTNEKTDEREVSQSEESEPNKE